MEEIQPRRIAAFVALVVVILVVTLGVGMLVSGGRPAPLPGPTTPAGTQPAGTQPAATQPGGPEETPAPVPTATPVPTPSFLDPEGSDPKASIEIPPPID